MKLDRIQLVFATSLFLISIIRIFPVNKTAMGIDLFLFVSLSIIFGNLIVYIMIERIDKEKWMGNYKYILEYAKANEGMLENYRLTAHETQNHLIILDNMIPKSNKKAHEYIASLTEEKEWKKYCFVNDLKYIPITELKGFINYKMMEMMNQNIHVQVTVSKEIENSKIKRLSRKEKEDLYNIIGVLLDNAKEGAKKSKKKEVIFQMYKEGKEIIILIANTYKGKIDVEKVGSYGYSTKGKGHGVGLHLVEMILGKSKRFTKETSLIDSYFIQKIRVK